MTTTPFTVLPRGRHLTAISEAGRANKGKRPDIQGLRTVAVGLVVLYHIWPDYLSGGFIGVDVFFVISGFLIIASLVREVAESGRIDLAGFYSKRIRRLLPASTLVLLATVVGTAIFLPQSRWQSISLDVIMSGFQVQNWNQAFSANSYAGATALASPVQHFWSLAVEEQFYLVIPLILLAAVAVKATMLASVRAACLAALVAVAVASFVHSVVFSSTEHDIAYFATSTRMWELCVGGIGAIVCANVSLHAVVRRLAGWVGLGLILVSAISFSTAMDFPGSIALLPVVGTMLVIVSGSPQAGRAVEGPSVTGLLSLRPLTYVGDVSYSLYLWHWPVVVFYVFLIGRPPGLIHGTIIIGISFGLALASYYLVEQRFRQAPFAVGARTLRTGRRWPLRGSAFVLAAGLIAVTSVSATATWSVVEAKSHGLAAELDLGQYPGATAFDPDRPTSVPGGLPVQPDPAIAMKDVPLTGKDECGTFDPASISVEQCVYGAGEAAKTIVVVGDSHAAQYVDPLVVAGGPSGWNVRAMVRNGCPFSSAPPAEGTTVYLNCSEQNKLTLQRILDLRPQLVVVSGMTPDGYKKALNWDWESPETLVSGYVAMLKPLREAGIRVAVIEDNPFPDVSAPDCLLKGGMDSGDCEFRSGEERDPQDPLETAAARVSGVEFLDMSSYFCREGTCPTVIGNVLVYRDNHMTNTYAKTLAPMLSRRLGI